MKRIKEHSTQRGFSIVELMITISIVAILSSVAMPSFNSLIESNAAKVAADDLLNALRFARGQALVGSQNILLCPSNDVNASNPVCGSDWSHGWVVRAVNSTGVVLARYAINKDVNISEVAGTSAVTFSRRLGQATNLDLRIFPNDSQASVGNRVQLLGSGLVTQSHTTRVVN